MTSVCEDVKTIAKPRQARRAGTRHQPSPEGLGHRFSNALRAPEARHRQTYGVPRLQRSTFLRKECPQGLKRLRKKSI